MPLSCGVKCYYNMYYFYENSPIMWETNLLRSFGGIHLAVIGWIEGHVAPWRIWVNICEKKNALSLPWRGEKKKNIWKSSMTYNYQHKAQKDSESGDCRVSEGGCQRGEEGDEAWDEHAVAKHSPRTNYLWEPAARKFCANVAPEETSKYQIHLVLVPIEPLAFRLRKNCT